MYWTNFTDTYYMANPVLGKSLCSDWFFLGQNFAVSLETVRSVYFCFGAKPANLTFATKPAKKKCENCHSSHWKYQQKLKRLKFFRNFKDGWRRRTFFKFKPPEVHFTIRNRVPYNKLLTNRACPGRTGKYWPSVRTVTAQYSPVRPSRSVSKRLIFLWQLGWNSPLWHSCHAEICDQDDVTILVILRWLFTRNDNSFCRVLEE